LTARYSFSLGPRIVASVRRRHAPTNQVQITSSVLREAALAERGSRPEDSTLAEMDALWDEMKRRERDPS
jgi:hypothetical protein